MNKPLGKQKAPPHIPDRPAVYYMPHELDQEDEINLLDLWRVLVRHKMIILSVTCISTLFALVYALQAQPVYRAEAILAPVGEESDGAASAFGGQFGDLASLAGINLAGKSGGSKQRSLAVLKSRNFTNKFILQENLMPALFAKNWDEENQQWLEQEDGNVPNAWDAYKVFHSIRIVSEDKKSGLIRLSIEWKDPQQAALWVNTQVRYLNQEMRQQVIGESEKSIAYLNQQLAQHGIGDIRQTIYRLIENQMKNIMMANTRDEFAFRVIDPAVVPQERIKPNRKMIVILGFMVGLIMAVFIAFIWSWIANLREQAGYSSPP